MKQSTNRISDNFFPFRINTSHSEDSVTKESSDVVLTKKNSDGRWLVAHMSAVIVVFFH